MKDQVVDIKEIQQSFENWQKEAGDEMPSKSIRIDALNQFLKLGFPLTKSEEWKYTNFSSVLKKGFTPIGSYTPGKLEPASFNSLKVTHNKAIRLVFVDGYFSILLSEIFEIDGFHFNTLSNDTLVENEILKLESLVALNTAFTKDGVVITIKENTIIDFPIEIYNITTCPGIKMIQPKHSISVGKGATVTFIESFHNLCMDSSFTNSVNSILIDQDAIVNYIKLEHPKKPNTYIFDHTMVEQKANSTFNLFTITLSGQLVRNNLYVKLNGVGANCILMGLYLLQNKEHVDNITTVDHMLPNGYSNELYKGILGGSSTGVFNGKIIVRENAQKTNAYQNNRNILVSEEATINSLPQLEIYANDVKCSHGATSSQIEDSELFYLRARGIGKQKAKSLLMYAFAEEILAKIKNVDVNQYLENEVNHALNLEF